MYILQNGILAKMLCSIDTDTDRDNVRFMYLGGIPSSVTKYVEQEREAPV